MCSTEADLLKLEGKEEESKKDDEVEWLENKGDSEEESSDNCTRENDKNDRSEYSNVSIIEKPEGNSGDEEEGEWN